jgi:hypothetical protein
MNTTDTRYIGDLGIEWCVKHHGVINEDSVNGVCDMADPRDGDQVDEEGELLPCVPRTLVYIAEPGDE